MTDDITQLPPLQVSQGGFAYNRTHIEYWRKRADVAERRHAQYRAIIAKLVEAAEVLLDEYFVINTENPHIDFDQEFEVIAMRAAIAEAKQALS